MIWNVRTILIDIVQVLNTNVDYFSKGISVNEESTSRIVMCTLESCWQSSSANWNESVTVNWLAVETVKNFSKNVANL